MPLPMAEQGGDVSVSWQASWEGRWERSARVE